MSTDPKRLWYDLMRRLGRGPELRRLDAEEALAEYMAAPHQPAPPTSQSRLGEGDLHLITTRAFEQVEAVGGQPASDTACADYSSRSMELVWQGQRGNAGAVNELFTRYIPRLRRILCIKINSAQRAAVDPEDVLQETLIVASRRLNELELRTPSSILQWLSKIADYEIKNRLEYLHAQKRDPSRELRMRSDSDSEDQLGVVVPSEDPTPSQSFARSELESLVDLHLKQLEPADYREVILLRNYYEADWEKIRSILDRPSIEAVQDLYKRAQKKLRERIARYMA